MSIKKEYKCDRCGHSQDTATQMWTVGVAIAIISSANYPTYPKGVKHWYSSSQPFLSLCRKCLELFGLLLAVDLTEDMVVHPAVMKCSCGHIRFEHGRYAWLRPEGKPDLELLRISEACDATTYRDNGDLYGQKCDCLRFQEEVGDTPPPEGGGFTAKNYNASRY